LYDVLYNKTKTIPLDGEILLPIIRDITQGIHFLHTATPQLIHTDLKAVNMLVDRQFRAKVADFGLSQKESEWLECHVRWHWSYCGEKVIILRHLTSISYRLAKKNPNKRQGKDEYILGTSIQSFNE